MAILKETTIKGSLTIFDDLDVQGTGYVKVASGTTSERPFTPSAGMIRYNTETDTAEYFEGSAWVSIDILDLQSQIDTLELVKLNKIDPTVDAEVKTVKVNETVETAIDRGEGTIKWNGVDKNLEYSDGEEWLAVGLGSGGVINGYNDLETETKPDLAFDEITRTFSVSVKSGSSNFIFWANSKEFKKTATESIVIPDTTGQYYIYFDSDGIINYVAVDDIVEDLFYTFAITGFVYWNATTQTSIVGSELHGKIMDARTHNYNHSTYGARFESGINIEGLAAGSPTFTQTSGGYFWDEDIRHSVPAQLLSPFMYRLGADGEWNRSAPDNNVSLNNGDAYDVWNEWTGTEWVLTAGRPATDFWIVFHMATPDITGFAVNKVLGQNAYRNANNARNAIESELSQLKIDGLPSPEFVFLYATIVKRDGELQALSDGSTYLDLRTSKGGAGGNSSASGLAQDIIVDSSSFTKNLTIDDVNVQAALETIDQLAVVTTEIDWHIGSTVEYMGAGTSPTGTITLTDTNQLLLMSAYPKLYTELGTKYGGDGITTFALPTIAQASGDEFVKDWSVIGSAWAGGSTINIPHSLATKFSDLEKRFIIRDPSAPDKEYNAEYTLFSSSSSKTFGQRLNSSGDINSINIQIGEGSSKYMSDTGLQISVPTTWEYKIVLTKDSPLPADVTLCMYVGNGSLSVANDAGIDSRVTALENQPIYADAPYDTGWVANSDWTGINLTINHGLGVGISSLIVKLFISETGSDDDAHDLGFVASEAATSYQGFSFAGADDDNIYLRTSSSGIRILTETGGAPLLDTESWYYKVVVRKHSAVSFINAQNAFINKKDWVTVWEGESDSVDVESSWGKCLIHYHRTNTTIHGTSIIWDLQEGIDHRQLGYQSTGGGTDWYLNHDYDAGTLAFGSAEGETGVITKIEQWQDTTGADKPSVVLDDGYETLWEDLDNTGSKTLPVEDGEYRALIQVGTEYFTADMTVDLEFATDATAFYGSWSSDQRVTYTPATGIWSVDTWNVIRIQKFKGVMSLDITHTREHVTGTPQFYYHALDTESGDYDFTPLLPVAPVAGDKLTITNTGTVVAGNYVENCPNGDFVAPQQTVSYTYNFTESVWRRDGNYTTEIKAKINFDGTGTVYIREQYNIASLEDLAVGKYRIAFAHDMDTANYIVSGVCSSLSGKTGLFTIINPTVSGFDIWVKNDASTLADRDTILLNIV